MKEKENIPIIDDEGIFVNSEFDNHNLLKFIKELTKHKDYCAEGALTITGVSIYIDENFIM